MDKKNLYAERMRQKITAAFCPKLLEIEDESARHAGHAGAHPQGETHFKIKIISAKFTGLSRVTQHRLVYNLLSEELAERVHALVLETHPATD